MPGFSAVVHQRDGSSFPNRSSSWNGECSSNRGAAPVNRSPNSHPEPPPFVCLFLSFLLCLKALSSNKQLFQSAALIKRNVLISPRQNIMLLCYHWSKSSKIQNKTISLMRSRSGMSCRKLPSSQVRPIGRKTAELKRRGWCWGERGCQGRNAEIKPD